jgi:plasmid stabilization system protein ParE
MRGVAFHPEARAELAAAARWYNKQRSGLGGQFRQEAMAAISRILQGPEAFGVIGGDVRCHILHRFPYGILYQIQPGRIFVVAVMHLHRDPEYWEHRV